MWIIKQKGGKMHKINKIVTSLKLNQKITLFVIIILAIPTIIFAMITFGYIEENSMRSRLEDTRISMANSQSIIQKNVEMCNLSTQVFMNTKSIMDYVIGLKEGKKLGTQDLIKFYKNDVLSLEKVVNSNPYLSKMKM